MYGDEDVEIEQELSAFEERDPGVRNFLRRALRTRKNYLRSVDYCRKGLARAVKTADGRLWFEPTTRAYQALAVQEMARYEMLRLKTIMRDFRGVR